MPATPPLAQFIFLSMLFHALAILLFGAPGGGSREGRAMWGSLQVVLLGAAPEPMPALKLDRGKLGARVERPAAPKASTSAEKAAAPAPRPQPPPTDAPFAFPQLLDRIVTPDLKLERLPPLRIPLPTETPFVPRPLPERVPPPEVAEPAPVAPPPPPVATPSPPIPAPLPVPAIATPPVERPPVEVQPIPVPTPPIERPPVETPAVPVPPRPSVERPPVELPPIPVPPTPAVTPPRVEPVPSALERALTPQPQPQIAPAPPPAIDRPSPRAPEVEVPRKVEPEPAMRAPPTPRAAPVDVPGPATVPRDDRRDAPSTTYDPTAPSIDLDAVRKRAGQIAREGTGNRALLPFPMPAPPERKSKEAIAIEKARKPDCRTAFKDLGLLAIAPLIANEFGEGNCRW